MAVPGPVGEHLTMGRTTPWSSTLQASLPRNRNHTVSGWDGVGFIGRMGCLADRTPASLSTPLITYQERCSCFLRVDRALMATMRELGELSSEISSPHVPQGDGRSSELVPRGGMQCPATHDDVSPLHELQPGLKDEDVQQINEVTEVIHQQPVVDVCWSLVGESPADRDQPAIPVPGHDNEEQPQHVHQICTQGTAPWSAGHTALLWVNPLHRGVSIP